MPAHPFRGVAIAGVHNTVQARRLPDHDSASIALAGALGALADAGISPHEVDGVVGPDCARIALELGLGPCTRRPSSLGIPDDPGRGRTDHHRPVRRRVGRGRRRRHPRRPDLDRTLDTAGERARRRVRAVHGRRIRPDGAPSHAHVRHHARTARDRRRHHPNNGHENPDAVYHGRGPFSPGDILASRMIADPFHLLDCATTSEGGCGLVLVAAERAAECRGAAVDPRGSQRLVRARLHGRTGVGLPASTRRRPRRHGRRPRGQEGFCDGRADAGRRRRRRTLRSVLVRDHPAAGGLRLLRPRRGRTVRRRREHRARLPTARHDGRRDHVVQSSRDQRAATTAGHSGGPAAPRCVHHEPGPSERRLPSARTAAPGPCSATSSFSVESAREPVAAPTGGHPGPPPEPPQRDVLERMSPTPPPLPTLRRMRLLRTRRVHRVRTVPRDVTDVGGQRWQGPALQLDGGVATAGPPVPGAVRPGGGPLGRRPFR